MLVTPVASALTPLPSDRGPGNSSAYKFSVPFTEYQWIIAQFRDGTYYAINGSDWNIMTIAEPWQPVAPWAALASNLTALEEQVLASTTSGKILLNEVAYNYNLTIPANVTVIESYNGLTRQFINSANTQGSPYTISVDTVQDGYHLAQDSAGRFLDEWSSTDWATVMAGAIGTGGNTIELTGVNFQKTDHPAIKIYDNTTITGTEQTAITKAVTDVEPVFYINDGDNIKIQNINFYWTNNYFSQALRINGTNNGAIYFLNNHCDHNMEGSTTYPSDYLWADEFNGVHGKFIEASYNWMNNSGVDSIAIHSFDVVRVIGNTIYNTNRGYQPNGAGITVGSGTNASLTWIQTGDVYIEQNTVIDQTPNAVTPHTTGIQVFRSKNVNINSNNIMGAMEPIVSGVNNITRITDNIINATAQQYAANCFGIKAYGTATSPTTSISILANYVNSSYESGIYNQYSMGTTIIGNTVRFSQYSGIVDTSSNNTKISNNILYNSGMSAYQFGRGISFGTVINTTISGNTIYYDISPPNATDTAIGGSGTNVAMYDNVINGYPIAFSYSGTGNTRYNNYVNGVLTGRFDFAANRVNDITWGGSTAQNLTTAGVVYVTNVYVPSYMSVSKIGVLVEAYSGSPAIAVALYSNNGSNSITGQTKLGQSVSAGITYTGTREIQLQSVVNLSPGYYFIAVMSNNQDVQVLRNSPAYYGGTATSTYQGYTFSNTGGYNSGTFDATAGTGSQASTICAYLIGTPTY